jgi:uncharacterized cofD-like protein
MIETKQPKIVVIGGGTGSFSLLNGLKNYTKDITALVNMADDGGSTGQLRDEFGVLPPGDVRQCLVALSNSPKVRELFSYRFEDSSLKGHAFGNLFLTALERLTGNFAEAVETASEVLNITGKVVPITLDNIRLVLEASDGFKVRGEGNIDVLHLKPGQTKPELHLEPKARINPEAEQAILEADMVVVAPGDIYTSLGPILIVDGVSEALAKTNAKIVYVCNLVTKKGQTDGFRANDFISELERFAGHQFIDHIIYNDHLPADGLIKKYAKDGEFAVEIDREPLEDERRSVIGADLLAATVWEGAQSSDPLAQIRTYIRHDPDKVARQLMKIYFE